MSLSNLTGSFFQCYAGSGSFTRSALNLQAGARTPLAGVFSALLVALGLLLPGGVCVGFATRGLSPPGGSSGVGQR